MVTKGAHLVNSSEAADNNGQSAQVAGLKGGVLTGRTFAIVVVANDDPLDTLITIILSDIGNGAPLASQLIFNTVRLPILSVHGTNQTIF